MTATAADLAGEPLWKLYAEWCLARASSLQERAATVAEQFAKAARHWPFDERKRFCLWLTNSTGLVMEQCGGSRFTSRFITGGTGLFAPREVVDAILLPTLFEWRREEPGNPEPHFWLGLYGQDGWSSLQEAIRLDPAHGPTRAAVAAMTLLDINYNQHELPSGYLGDPVADLATLTEVEALVAEAVDPGVRQSFERQTSAHRVVAEDWIRLCGQLKGLDWEARNTIWRARPSNRSLRNS